MHCKFYTVIHGLFFETFDIYNFFFFFQIEVDNYFFILYHIKNMITLKDCVTFSPMLLNSCHAKPLFIIYQLLQVMKDSHDRGLVLGNLQLDDIFVNDNLFIQVLKIFCRLLKLFLKRWLFFRWYPTSKTTCTVYRKKNVNP